MFCVLICVFFEIHSLMQMAGETDVGHFVILSDDDLQDLLNNRLSTRTKNVIRQSLTQGRLLRGAGGAVAPPPQGKRKKEKRKKKKKKEKKRKKRKKERREL